MVRLSPSIPEIEAQAGYVSCDPALLGDDDAPLHVALQAAPAKVWARGREGVTHELGGRAGVVQADVAGQAGPRASHSRRALPLPPPPHPHPTPSICHQPVSEFQAFKHMECLAPGTIQKASAPLEVTLSVQPTLQLQVCGGGGSFGEQNGVRACTAVLEHMRAAALALHACPIHQARLTHPDRTRCPTRSACCSTTRQRAWSLSARAASRRSRRACR